MKELDRSNKYIAMSAAVKLIVEDDKVTIWIVYIYSQLLYILLINTCVV